MKQIHEQEKEQFKKLFKQEGIDQFENRFKVLEGFLQTEKHVTDSELIRLLEDRGYGLTPDFVRDTLELMCHFGFAHKNRFDNGDICYEHRHLGQHHDHMICTKCRKIIEFSDEELEQLQVRVAEANQFHMLQHRMEIYGICSDCAKERVKLMPLVKAKAGEHVVIAEITGGSRARMRLSSMGLREGDTMEVVTNHFDLNPSQLKSSSRNRVVTRARSIICSLAIDRLMMKGAEVARQFNLTPSAVSKLSRRGRNDSLFGKIEKKVFDI